MILAYDYPLLGILWTTLVIFFWIAWIFLVIRIFADIFRNRDMSGWAKALWTIFVVLLPFLGVLVYLIVHGGDMHERDIEQAKVQQEAVDSYIKQAAGTSGGVADEINKLGALRDQGVLTAEEFDAQKAKLLS